jgi:hypothetical protein
VILNTLDSVTALLDKKGNIYANRPVFTMVGELVGTNRVLHSCPLLEF